MPRISTVARSGFQGRMQMRPSSATENDVIQTRSQSSVTMSIFLCAVVGELQLQERLLDLDMRLLGRT